MTINEPETACEAETSSRFSKWIFSNKLYRSTELGGLHYIPKADSKSEVLFWYVLFFTFSAFAGYHLYVSTDDLRHQNVETKIYAKVPNTGDFKVLTNWTLCKNGEFGSHVENASNWDIRYMMVLDDMVNLTFKELAAHFMFRLDKKFLEEQKYSQSTPIKIGRDLNGPNAYDSSSNVELQRRRSEFYLARFQLVYRKYVQLEHRYMRTASALFEHFLQHSRPTVFYIFEGSFRLKSPGDVWLMIYDHYDDYMNETSFLSRRIEFVRNCNRQLLSTPNPYSNTSISEYYTALRRLIDTQGLGVQWQTMWQETGNVTAFDELYDIVPTHLRHCIASDVTIDYTVVAPAYDSPPNINIVIDTFKDYNLSRFESLTDQIAFLNRLEQIFLADVIGMFVGEESATWFHGGNLTSSLRMVHEFQLLVEERVRLDDRYQQFVNDYYDRYILNDAETEAECGCAPSLLFVDNEMECVLMRCSKGPAQTTVMLRPIYGKSPIGPDPTFAEHQKWMGSWSVSAWIAPVNPEPVLEKSNEFKMNEQAVLSLAIARSSTLLPDKQSCGDKGMNEFNCLLNCNDQHISDHGHCNSTLANFTSVHGSLPVCRFTDMLTQPKLMHFTGTLAGTYIYRNVLNDTQRCSSICRLKAKPPCQWTSFTANMKIVGDSLGEWRTLRIMLKVEVPGDRYYLMVQTKIFDPFQWIATIGGVLEFWLGAGLLSLIHFVLYFVKMAIRHLNRHLRQRRALRSHAAMITTIAGKLPSCKADRMAPQEKTGAKQCTDQLNRIYIAADNQCSTQKVQPLDSVCRARAVSDNRCDTLHEKSGLALAD